MTQGHPIRHILIGNPDNRRVIGYRAALASLNQPEPRVFSHAALLANAERLLEVPDEPHVVRIDATGENGRLERGLLELGYDEDAGPQRCLSPAQLAARPLQTGEILAPRQYHRGFLRHLARLDAVFARRPTWRILNPVADVAELFDKRETWRRWRQQGLPVPEALEGVETVSSLHSAMAERGWRSVFVKVSCASSASCLAVVSLRDEGLTLQTTVRRTDTGWFNSLKVQRVADREGIETVLQFLLAEGAQVERNVPKARLAGAFMDCRVVAVAGEPVFWVVRQSRHPITNLHLGGWRGDSEALIELAGDEWRAALDSCRKLAALYGNHQIGIDVLFERGFRGHRILEANAFGDLLPGLTRDGLNLYQWQIRALLRAAPRP